MVTSLLLGAAIVLQNPTPAVEVSLQGPTRKFGARTATLLETQRPVSGVLRVTFPEGWHGYQNPPSGEFEIPVRWETTQPGFRLTAVRYPSGSDLFVSGSTTPTKVYGGKIEIPFTLVATRPTTGPTFTEAAFQLHYQLCNDSTCLPPATVTVRLPIRVAAKKVNA